MKKFNLNKKIISLFLGTAIWSIFIFSKTKKWKNIFIWFSNFKKDLSLGLKNMKRYFFKK